MFSRNVGPHMQATQCHNQRPSSTPFHPCFVSETSLIVVVS
jgi:hypothetical protein